jgi:hypothetical protein
MHAAEKDRVQTICLNQQTENKDKISELDGIPGFQRPITISPEQLLGR